MIRKLSSGQYRLFSKKSHRNLGTFPTLKAAKKHERQVEFFKYATKHNIKLRNEK